jgi:MFS family permease
MTERNLSRALLVPPGLPPAHPNADTAPGRPKTGAATWVLALGVLDFSLEQTMLVPAQPAIGLKYNASVSAVAWLTTGLLLSSAVAMPLAGRLGDRYGRKRLLMVSLATFALGSLVCALGQSIEMLIAGRVLQGLGAGIGPLALALLPEAVGPEKLSRSVGAIVGAGALGAVLGLLAAGPLVDHLGVPSIFWAMFALSVALAFAVSRAVPESTVHSTAPVDWLGALLLSGSLATAVLAIAQGNDWGWTSTAVVILLFSAVILLFLFVLSISRAAAPLLDPSSLGLPPVLGANVAGLVVGIALFGAYLLVPYIAGLPEVTGFGLGLTTTQIGLLLAPGSVGALLGGLAGGRMIKRIGARMQVVLGMACAAVAYGALIVLPWSVATLALTMVPLGFGIGTTLVAIVDVLLISVRDDETGGAMGLNTVLRNIGSAMGTAVASAILLASPGIVPGVPSQAGFTRAFGVGLAGSVGAVLLMLVLPTRGADVARP